MMHKINFNPYKSIIICIFIAAATLVVYWQIGNHEFIHFDDDSYITLNPYVNTGLTTQNLLWAFGFTKVAYWHPLTWLSHMLDCQLFGLNAGRHHLMNLLFHLLNSILLFIVLWKMTGSSWRSGFVAALFALHPVNVDTVAWAAERKNVLSTFFWLLTMLTYVQYTRNLRLSKYILLLFVFVLGLLSKPMLVTLPFVLLLMDYWPLKRFSFSLADKTINQQKYRFEYQGISILRLITEKIPLIILALIAISISILSTRNGSADLARTLVPMTLRIENAIVSYVIYLWKMFFPLKLSFFYPYPDFVPLWQVAGALIIIILISFASVRLVIRAPYFIVGWLWFLGTLFPVSGLMQGGLWPAIGERWAYVPYIGLFMAVAWGAHDILSRFRNNKEILSVSAAVVLIAFMSLTWRQTAYWKDCETLARHALAVTDNNFIAYNNLGIALFEKDRIKDSIIQLQQAVSIRPDYAPARNNLGKVLFKDHKFKESLAQFEECLKSDPKDSEAYKFIGFNMLALGNKDGAARNFSEALKLDPRDEEASNYLGVTCMNQGNIKKAIECFQKAIDINPQYKDAVDNLNEAKSLQKKITDQISNIENSIKADSKNPALHVRLGDIFRQQGEYDEAIKEYQSAISLQPKLVQAMSGLVFAYSEKKEYAKSIEILQNLRQMQPDNPEIYYNIACVYSKQNMIEESTKWLDKSIQKGFSNWNLIKTDPDLANIRGTTFVSKLLKNH